jgi:hypothetical protein
MAPQAEPTRADSGIELTTLFLSAVASAAAAYVTSKIWAPGTLFSAAMSPVIVALVKEGLRKPTEAVANVVPAVVPASTRWSRAGAGEPGLVVDPGAAPPEPVPHVDPDAPHVVLPPVVSGETGPVRVYTTRARRLRWRLAVITGLLGFGVCVVLYTVPELISGQSIGRGGRATTLWGGHRSHTKKSTTSTQTTTTKTSTSSATTPTTTDDTKTVTQTQTVTAPAQTTTAPSTATPAPAVTPSTAAPPSTTTP